VDRTPGREKVPGTAEEGYLHCGPEGAGHFVKMVHNGIEYGIMAAYGEGLNILKHANAGKTTREVDAETTPLRNPEHYQYDFPLADIAEVWRRGSVVASWLLDLTAIALIEDPKLSKFSGRVSDSGEGRWTILAAIESWAPAAKTISRRRFYPRCASSSADTSSAPPAVRPYESEIEWGRRGYSREKPRRSSLPLSLVKTVRLCVWAGDQC
jgi:6-phosphogluconate dehydrogenase